MVAALVGEGNGWPTARTVYNSQALGIKKIGAALSRMNTGLSHKSDWDVLQEIPPERLYYYLDYVTLRQQLHGTFVTLEVINITAVSTARREQRQLREQRVVESRGLHAHVH